MYEAEQRYAAEIERMGPGWVLNVRACYPGAVSEPAVKNKLRVLRAGRDWSQGDLAERLGVSRQTVNALETSKNDPSLPLAFNIAQIFGGHIADIFEPEERASAT
jgi:putative transcriptional regulator